MLEIGQALFGIARFRDGKMASYKRPFLVVYVDSEKVGLLNVSSTAGKEHKLLYESNRRIINYNPPFKKDSFIKLDSLIYISVEEVNSFTLLCNGEKLNDHELNHILDEYERY